jgi:hypothetical protein
LVRSTNHKNSSVCSLLHCPVTALVLGPNILLDALFSNTLILRSSLNVRDKFYSHTQQQAKLFMHVLNFIFCDSLATYYKSSGFMQSNL